MFIKRFSLFVFSMDENGTSTNTICRGDNACQRIAQQGFAQTSMSFGFVDCQAREKDYRDRIIGQSFAYPPRSFLLTYRTRGDGVIP